MNTGEIPSNAVEAGIDKDGGKIYVGRALHEGELHPAKVVPNHDCAYISYNGEEVRMEEYEVNYFCETLNSDKIHVKIFFFFILMHL